MTMANITLSPERRAQILRGVRPRRGKALCWTTGRILVAAVLAVLLTFSAFAAAVPALRKMCIRDSSQRAPKRGGRQRRCAVNLPRAFDQTGRSGCGNLNACVAGKRAE